MTESLISAPGDQTAARPPLSLYIHLPWCRKRCPYCDFNAHLAGRDMPETAYTDALQRELENAIPTVWGRRLRSVFIGGGTPSLFAPESIARLLATVRALFNPPPDTEITLEANPDSAESAKFAEYRAAGVNRLSVGIQSFDDDSLRQLGRVHNAAAAHRAAEVAAAHFDNFNLDLMHALPRQSESTALADLRAALSYRPPHLSLYQLTLEPDTPFFKSPPARLPSADASADIGDAVCRAAVAADYAHYEISAYARPNRQCAHNLNYWLYGDYLGVGAGAHSKITTSDGIVRADNIKRPQEYIARAPDAARARQTVAPSQAFFELMLNALRLPAGFPRRLVVERAGLPSPRSTRRLNEAQERGWIVQTPTHIRPTPLGLRYLNDLTALFLPS